MKQTYSLMLMAIFLFYGCDSQTDPLSNNKDYDTPLSINSVAMLDAGGTRSTTTLTSADLGLFCLAGNGYSAKKNVFYRYSPSGFLNWDPIYLGTQTASVCAYYPYDPQGTVFGITDSTDPTSVTLISRGYNDDRDLCYSTKVSTLSKFNSNLSLVMNHAYAKLTINITNNMGMTLCRLTQVSIANSGILTTTTLDMTTGTYAAGTSGTVKINLDNSFRSNLTDTESLLMVPVTTPMKGNIVFTFVVNGSERLAYVDAASSGLSTLLPGGNYTVNFNVVN